MGRDKAQLAYGDGVPQLERAMRLLAAHLPQAYVSVRAEQRADPLRARYEQIPDTQPGLGPIAGILAAQQRHPQAAWLVLACDLPLLDAATLEHLLQARAPERAATAYRSSHDGLPEPLCAIWEPRSHEALAAYAAAGHSCPRRFLQHADTQLLDEPNPRALDNINTPAEYGLVRVMSREQSIESRQLTVQYYALLREQAGRREESLRSSARDPRELYGELAARYPFTLAPEVLRVAINGEFSDWGTPLTEGDAVVFIPPVAGG